MTLFLLKLSLYVVPKVRIKKCFILHYFYQLNKAKTQGLAKMLLSGNTTLGSAFEKRSTKQSDIKQNGNQYCMLSAAIMNVFVLNLVAPFLPTFYGEKNHFTV
jgi:hypothetical protein